jgi:hypothetical protein
MSNCSILELTVGHVEHKATVLSMTYASLGRQLIPES